METWQGHKIKWASEINNRLRINEPAELSSVSSSSSASCIASVLSCSPHLISHRCRIILQIYIKSRERALHGHVLGHSVIEATKAKFHSPEVWWFPDGILGSSQPKQKPKKWLVSGKMNIWHFCILLSHGSLVTVTVCRDKERPEAISVCCDIL